MGVAPDFLNLTRMEYSARRVAEMLDSTSWAKDFNWPQMIIIGNYFKPYSIAAGLPLFEEGSQGNSMGILVSGLIDIYKRNQVIATLRPGRTYGEMSLIDHQPRSARAVARQDSQILIIDRDDFVRLSDEHPRLALAMTLKIAYFLSQSLRKTSCDLSALLTNPADWTL